MKKENLAKTLNFSSFLSHDFQVTMVSSFHLFLINMKVELLFSKKASITKFTDIVSRWFFIFQKNTIHGLIIIIDVENFREMNVKYWSRL